MLGLHSELPKLPLSPRSVDVCSERAGDLRTLGSMCLGFAMVFFEVRSSGFLSLAFKKKGPGSEGLELPGFRVSDSG